MITTELEVKSSVTWGFMLRSIPRNCCHGMLSFLA
ncbi:hypothetical protein SLEP1_g44157 [Rubroshorea leprosula]|uniref:Uncharacterized protein n=1 Tax=Rubroshorea leprosula TaxID=152421 RepID=A0AAV5LFP5_9ROSI|nr:hypothetical protein SLEP1_g44157 [Rubroshorea leprosula]